MLGRVCVFVYCFLKAGKSNIVLLLVIFTYKILWSGNSPCAKPSRRGDFITVTEV